MHKTAKQRVLVLGGSGRVGRMLRHSWAQNGGGLDFTFQTREHDAAHSTDLVWDVMDPPPSPVLNAAPFDCMIVLSGVVPGPDADFTRNSAIGAAAIAAAARLGIPCVLLASTSAVYGAGGQTPFHEGDTPCPVNAYGHSKHLMEVQCRAQALALGISLCCLRIGNVAGADALLLNAQALADGDALVLDVFAQGGTPVRSYIGADSLARVLCTLVHQNQNRDVPELLNIAAPHPVSMRALAESAGVAFDLRPAPPTAHQLITLDCTALATLHSFDPAESDPDEMVLQWRHCTGGLA